jgi:hypothetical protein
LSVTDLLSSQAPICGKSAGRSYAAFSAIVADSGTRHADSALQSYPLAFGCAACRVMAADSVTRHAELSPDSGTRHKELSAQFQFCGMQNYPRNIRYGKAKTVDSVLI